MHFHAVLLIFHLPAHAFPPHPIITYIQSFMYSSMHLFIHPPSFRGVNNRLWLDLFILLCQSRQCHSYSFICASIRGFFWTNNNGKLTQRCGETTFDRESWEIFTNRDKSLFTLRILIPLVSSPFLVVCSTFHSYLFVQFFCWIFFLVLVGVRICCCDWMLDILCICIKWAWGACFYK